MKSAEEIELAVLGRLYRRISELSRRAQEDMDRAIVDMQKTLRNGEYRGIVSIGCVLVDEFAQPLVGREENVFENPIFNGEYFL